jgi:hypothetical protein
LFFEVHVHTTLLASGIAKSVYAGTSGDGAGGPVIMELTAAPQLQQQAAPASKSPTSTLARVSKDKVYLATCFNSVS